MNSFIRPGLSQSLPEPEWLMDGRGRRLAFNTFAPAHSWLHVLISHGFSEHRGWWHHVALGLNRLGITAHLFDHFHHGLSDGRPADVTDYRVLSDGLALALHAGVQPRREDGAPLALLAHSNGALVALGALGQIPSGAVNALVLSSPLLGLSWHTMAVASPAAWLMNWIHPALKIPLSRNPERLTSNREIWPDLERDPLRFSEISVRFYRAMAEALRDVQRVPDCGGLPLLMLTSALEQVVQPSAMLRWFDQANTPDKRRITYPGRRHELFNDTGWDVVLSDMVDWLADRFPGRPAETEWPSPTHATPPSPESP